jgi:hypothetical protein
MTDVTDTSDITDVTDRTEGSEGSVGAEDELPHRNRRYRHRYRLRQHRSLWVRRPSLMVLAAALPATLLLIWNASDWSRPVDRHEAPRMTSPSEIRRLAPPAKHGIAGVFGPPLPQEGQSEGFGPERSPLPYLVIWLPILLVLELIRREVRRRIIP